MKKVISILIFIFIILLTGCSKVLDTHHIVFDINTNEAYIDGKKINKYDYVWHIDPKGDYDVVKDSPAEYYTGDAPNEDDGVWIAHDIKYFPIVDRKKFYKSDLGTDPEWAADYENEKYKDLVFANLPRNYDGDEFPYHMMHSAEEAYNNPCLHITVPGIYNLSGKWKGQIFVDLGKGAETDSTRKITLILDNLNVNCTVAPGINIYRAYECDNTWKKRKNLTKDIILDNTGVNIVLKDNTKNYLNGANVYRICKTVLKKNGKSQKVAVKYDGALSSDVSFSINGEKLNNGELYVDSTLEGISSNLHMVFNGGKTYINSADDGINCNEDDVSILKINGGSLYVNAGLLYQGDGLDSNGYIVINGGDTVAIADFEQDPGIDAPQGVYVNGGKLIAFGETDTIDWPKVYLGENTNQAYIFKCFDSTQLGDSRIAVLDENGDEVYTFSETDYPSIKARPFIGTIISTPEIKKGKRYEVTIKP